MATTVTLQTIADPVGVSRTTVSTPSPARTNCPTNCAPGSSRLPPVSTTADRTRRRARCAGAGRRHRGGADGLVGVGLCRSYNVEFLGALAGEAEAGRHSLLVIPAPPGDDQAEGVRSAVVDGFCVYTLPDRHPSSTRCHAATSRPCSSTDLMSMVVRSSASAIEPPCTHSPTTSSNSVTAASVC